MSNRPVDLTNCDREPIHVPGSVQAHGCLLACDAAATVVLRRSENARAFLGVDQEILGLKLDDVVGTQLAHDIRNALAISNEPAQAGLVRGRQAPGGRPIDIAVHQHKGVVVIEFEEPREEDGDPLSLVNALMGRMRRFASVDELTRSTPRLLRAMLGYDRVMIYRFATDGSGQVISEARRGGLESFMGQHFPASDIPQQARRLYVENTIRVVADASGASSPIAPIFDASGEPLDLSFARLRSVSPIHCEYLRNMGVSASMSISVIVEGALWGLIACHHYAPRSLSAGMRAAAELFGEFFSLHLEALLDKNRLASVVQARSVLDRLLKDASESDNLADLFSNRLENFLRLVPSDGVALLMNGRWTSQGSAPPEDAMPALARFMANAAEGTVFGSHSLSQRLPSAEAYRERASGVLAIPLSQHPRDYVFLFRKEVLQTVEWAGDPNKEYGTGSLGERLTPRKSFAIWKETVQGQSLPWTTADRDIAEAARAALVEVVLRNAETLEEEREKATVRQRMLNQELNHRVKNILSLIKSLVSQPVESERTLHDYVASLKARIQALSNAHDQVVRGSGGGMLRALLEAELSPYAGVAKILLDGPDVALDARAYSVMALVLHELATNAAKYGALSRRGGSLAVRWSLDEFGSCELHWRERGGPAVSAPSRTGFGTVLLDRSLPHDLGGVSDIIYDPAGVQARFLIPGRHIVVTDHVADRSESFVPPPQAALTTTNTLSGQSVLLVEDQLMIALEAETMLFEAGVENVETFGNVRDALAFIGESRPDFAVLDINLGAELSIPVARALKQRGIPYIFATGYGETGLVPEDLAKVPVIRKPYELDSLVAAILAVR